MLLIEHILSAIAPHACLGCGYEGRILCVECGKQLIQPPSRCYRCQCNTKEFRTCKGCRSSSVLFSVQPITEFDGVSKQLVHKLKYERLREGARVIGGLMATEFGQIDKETIVTHVPTATSRVRQRGYDQAALIARRLALLSGCEYTPLLARVGQQQQVGKNRRERRQQMQELFLPTKQILNKHILLVDDVITTGATLEACAKVLKSAGARRVSAAVFAAA